MSCKKKKIENTLFDAIFGLYLCDAKNDEEKSMKRFDKCLRINIVMKSIGSRLYQKKTEEKRKIDVGKKKKCISRDT